MIKKYDKFQDIIDTMDEAGYDYKKGYQWTLNNLKRRREGNKFSMQEHLSTMIFAQLSNQRPWKPIADNSDKIREIFHDFDAEFLKNADPEELTNQIRAIRCGNRQIAKQMQSLKDNVLMLEKIEKEYGSVDDYYNSVDARTLVRSLSSGKYKIKQMGYALISEYLKGVGIDIVKPDVHVCRILGRMDYTKHNPGTVDEVYDVCEKIAQEYGISNIEVDSILWQFCADGYFHMCTDEPNCEKCKARNCMKLWRF